MRRFLAGLCAVCMLIGNALPLVAFAREKEPTSGKQPTKPYEKVVAKVGEWFTDRIEYDNTSNLVIGYTGKYETDKPVSEMAFNIGEKIVATGICIPIVANINDAPEIEIKDSEGNIYQGFYGEIEITNNIREKSETDESVGYNELLIYTTNGEVVFPKGVYTIQLSVPEIANGSLLVKGMSYEGVEKYKAELKKIAKNKNKDLEEKNIGDTDLAESVSTKFEPIISEIVATKKPAVFGLDAEYGIDEILINTYNDGKGVIPGTISILDEAGNTLLTEKASGHTFSGIANGMWRISPMVLLPEGIYYIKLSNPSVWTYDESGEPLFFVKASIPVEERYNFTGTYMVNVDAYKTSTLMGTVSEKESSFSLKNFELTVLDRGTGIELVGKYEDMPFSQLCEIIEETDVKVTGKFNFGADLSKLPYNATISTSLVITLKKQGNGGANIEITGEALYTREATKEKGADRNTYDIVVTGKQKSKELPIFVVAALGKSNSVGNIPGPGSPEEAATGMLFPPLVGLVTNVITEMIKKKDAEDAKQKAQKNTGVRRDKEWYKKQYPGKTDEQIAMIMLADAMGNTDEPDEGDALSIGDDEKRAAKETARKAEDEAYKAEQDREEREYEAEQEREDARREEEDRRIEEEIRKEKEAKAAEEKAAEAEKTKAEEKPKTTEETPEEPETMVLKTSGNGAETLYIKDPKTGKWHNAETGNELDYDDYKNRVVKEMDENKKWNDAEFEKNSKGEMEQDLINREEMKKIKDERQYQEYVDNLKKKYHIDDEDDLWDFLESKQEIDKANADKWNMIGDINAVGEAGAKVVSTGADIGIDILSEATGPAGKGIKAGYKILKSTAGNVAEKQVTREGGATLGDVFEGAIKGAGDAATDFINIDNKYANAAAKAATNVFSETTGSMVGAAMNKEDIIEAGKAGLVDGVTKATVNTVTDVIAGDTPEIPTDVSIKDAMKKVIVNRNTATKAATAVADELAIKPTTDEIKDFIKNEPKKK